MIKIKWRVEGYPIIIDINNKIWRDRFTSNNRTYNYKELNFHIHQGKEYLIINRKRVSLDNIRNKLYRVNETINITQYNEDLPF
jgi:hypothetical protein